MSELEKRLSALYLVCDETIADDIKKHVNAEIDRLKQAVEVFRNALTAIEKGNRTISGKGSTSTDTKAWWLYGPYAQAAIDALERGDAILKGEDSGKGRYCEGCQQTWPDFKSWHDHNCAQEEKPRG